MENYIPLANFLFLLHFFPILRSFKQLKGGVVILDVAVTQSATIILELLSFKEKTLLIRWDSFLLLKLSLDVGHGGVGVLDVHARLFAF
jgi:hypothetical protein